MYIKCMCSLYYLDGKIELTIKEDVRLKSYMSNVLINYV